MTLILRSTAVCVLGGLLLGLPACGRQTSNSTAEKGVVGPQYSGAETPKAVAGAVPAPTLADGPDVCFRAVAKHLGANTKVSEISSLFSTGSDIDSNRTKPKGQMMLCTVQYQSPTDPRKLAETSLDIDSGVFSPPKPVEITVMGGDESKFRLDAYLIPLSSINAAGLTAIMEAQKPKLGSVFSRYAWSGVSLSAPDGFSRTHMFRLDVTGRLASNDIKKDGYALVTTDAKTIKTNFLTS